MKEAFKSVLFVLFGVFLRNNGRYRAWKLARRYRGRPPCVSYEKNTKDKPLVSIVAPAYNHGAYIEESLKSVANQPYHRMELIVVDDCSRDDTAERVARLMGKAEFAERFERIELVRHNENIGASRSINDGVARATGELITIINTDDLYEGNRLDEMVGAMLGSGSGIAFSAVRVIDECGKPLDNYEARKILAIHSTIHKYTRTAAAVLRNNAAISTGNLMFTKELFERIGGFNSYPHIHDWDFLLRAALIGEPLFVGNTAYLYRIHSTNSYKELEKRIAKGDMDIEKMLSNLPSNL